MIIHDPVHFLTALGLVVCREALKKFSPRVLRIMFALTPWDKPMTYSDAVATTARQREGTLVSFFSEVEAVLHKFGPRGSQGRLPTRWEVQSVLWTLDISQ